MLISDEIEKDKKVGSIKTLIKSFNDILNITGKIDLNPIDENSFLNLETSNLNFYSTLGKLVNNKYSYLENQDELENIFINYKKIVSENIFQALVVIILINKTSCSIPNMLLEKLFYENKFIIDIFCLIFKKLDSFEKSFFIPNIEEIINFIFKFPDKLANILEYSLINRHQYFYELFEYILINQIFTTDILNKISNLKLLRVFTEVLRDTSTLKNNSFHIKISDLFQKSVFYEDYVEALFNTRVITKFQFNNISCLINQVNVCDDIRDYFKDKLIGITEKNINFVSLVLLSENSQLVNMYIHSLLNILKKREEIERLTKFTFFIILFSFYFFLERLPKEETLMSILDSLFKMQGNIIEQLIEDKMKKIYNVFSKYIMSKLSSLLKSKNINIEDEKEKEELDINKLSEEEIEILNFKNIEINLLNNPLYVIQLKDIFDTKILKIKKELNSESNELSKSNTKENIDHNKTRYISVKFQKKYGEYNKEKKNLMLEFESKEKSHLSIKLHQNQNSVLKINLDKEDDYSDLDPLSTPMYLKDCLLGLSSEFPDRQKLSLERLPELINSKPFDLDFLLPQISEVLLKSINTFELENFENLVSVSLTRLTVFNPVDMTVILCNRFFHEESGIKNKFQVLTVIEKSIEEISEYYNKTGKNSRVNKLHVFFQNIISPLLGNLKQSNIDSLIIFPEFDYLLAKFLILISKLIKFSENHPFIYKALFDSMDLFKAILYNKSLLIHKSIILIDAMNFYSSVLSKFLNTTFLEIYPEFFLNFKIILAFLHENLELVKKEELVGEMMKNLNNYIINLEKLKNITNNRGKSNDLLIL